MSAPPPLGVTVIGGFLGAGKTTLLSRVLRDPEAGRRRLGVLVNDFGELPVDAALVRGLVGDVVRLDSGCVCCTIGDDFTRALLSLKDDAGVEHAIVETSGISDTEALAARLVELERLGALRLDAVITVVDAEQVERARAEHGALVGAQLRAADVVLLNKLDLVDAARADALEAELSRLAPRARVVRTVQADVPLDVVVGLEGAPRGDRAHPHDHAHPHAAEFTAWTFRESRPMRWTTLGPLLASLPRGIARAKGVLQLVERPGARVLLQVVGHRLHVRTVPPEPGEPLETAFVLVGTGAAALREVLEPALRAAAEGDEPGRGPRPE